MDKKAERDFALVDISDFGAFSDVPKTDKSVTLSAAKLFADGGSRGNPGPSASGFVIYNMGNNVVKKEGIYVGVTTNNQAEYKALIFGLQAAIELGVKDLEVYMDSLLVINQVQGIWKINNLELKPLHAEILELVKNFDKIKLSHVPRALNKDADAMVNECLDAR